MNGISPQKVPLPPQNAFAVIGERGVAALVERGDIREHHDVLVRPLFLEPGDAAAAVVGEHVVRVQPENIVGGRFGKGKIARFGKIVAPGERVDVLRKRARDFNGVVRASGIHNDDFVRQFRDGTEAAAEQFLFVFGNDTYAQSFHTVLYEADFKNFHEREKCCQAHRNKTEFASGRARK